MPSCLFRGRSTGFLCEFSAVQSRDASLCVNHHWQRIGEPRLWLLCVISCVNGATVMLWAMFCSETLGPANHVDVTSPRTTSLSIVADHVHPFIETLFPDGCGVFQHDNVRYHKAKIVQDWFEDHDNEFEVLRWPPYSRDLNPISICGMCWTIKSDQWRPHLTTYRT